MSGPLRVLHLEDNATDADLVESWLEQAGIACEFKRVESREGYERQLAQGGFDMIFADQTTPDFDGLSALALAQKLRAEVPFIFVSGTLDEDVAITSLRNGATDYVLKQRLNRLIPAVERAIEEQGRRRELVQASRALEAQAELLDLASDMILIRDMDHRITFWNRGAEKVYGWPKDEALGQNVYTLLRTEFPESLRHIEAQLLSSGHWQGELVQQTANGARLVVSSHWTLRRDALGNPASVLTIDTDLTERRKLETQLRQAQKLEDLGTLVGGIAHDFNNTLNIIVGCGDLIAAGPELPEESSEMVEHILIAAERGAALVRQLLTFSRRSETRLEPLALNTVVEEVLRMLKRTFPKTIEFRTDLDPSTPRILADSGQLYQVLLNLSVNARDVMPEGGLLKFCCECVPAEKVRAKFADAQGVAHASLSVTDTGAGMDEKTRQRIFEPFFTTKAAGHGTGLGLAVVYGVVQSHRGFIEVESKPGHGSTFRLYFPEAAVESVSDAASEPESVVTGGTETLLLVEDENLYRDLIASILEQRGYHVLTASDGAAALQLFRERAHEIDLVVSDLSLPQMSGSQLVNHILATKPGQKILICSGYIEPPLRARLKELGVMEFLIKPYRPVELLSRVRALLDGAGAKQSAVST